MIPFGTYLRAKKFGKNSRFYDGVTRMSTLMPGRYFTAAWNEFTLRSRIYSRARALPYALTGHLSFTGTERYGAGFLVGVLKFRCFEGACVLIRRGKRNRAMKLRREDARRGTERCSHEYTTVETTSVYMSDQITRGALIYVYKGRATRLYCAYIAAQTSGMLPSWRQGLVTRQFQNSAAIRRHAPRECTKRAALQHLKVHCVDINTMHVANWQNAACVYLYRDR